MADISTNSNSRKVAKAVSDLQDTAGSGGTLDLRVDDLETAVTAAEGDIDDLETSVGAVDVTARDADLATAEAAIAVLSQIFSTAEKASGRTWIGGAIVYEKTLAVAAGPNNNTVSVAHGITGLAVLVAVQGSIKTGAGVYMLLPADSGGAGGGGIAVNVDGTNVDLTSDGNYADRAGFVTLWYTKA